MKRNQAQMLEIKSASKMLIMRVIVDSDAVVVAIVGVTIVSIT